MGSSGRVSVAVIGLCALLLQGCEAETHYTNQPSFETAHVYFSTVRNVELEVAYEEGAEPYFGEVTPELPAWDFTRQTLQTIFDARNQPVSLKVPKTIEDTTKLPKFNQATWTLEQIKQMASVRLTHADPEKASFFIVFLKGAFIPDGAASAPTGLVGGLFIENTSIIAIFVDALRPSYSSQRYLTFLEQMTLAHELGHAVGLVDLGIPQMQTHMDPDSAHHCQNKKCALSNRPKSYTDYMDFVVAFLKDAVVRPFDQDCLDDIRNFRP